MIAEGERSRQEIEVKSPAWKGRTFRERASAFMNLLYALVRRDVTARYRRAMLGPLWVVLQPLVLMVVFTAIRNVISIPSDGLPYALFSYTALIPYQFLSGAVSRAGQSVVSNAAVLKKMPLAREVFPLAGLVVALFDMAMAGLVMVGMMVYYQVEVGWALLWLPLLVLLVALLAFGVGMFIAALGTYRSDFLIATPFLMQIWMYASPIIYPMSSVPERWRWLYQLNPLVGLVEGFRNVLLHASSPSLDLLGWSAVSTVVIYLVSWILFRWMAQYFADVL